MKTYLMRVTCFLLTACMALSCLIVSAGARTATEDVLLLASDGMANYVIVCGANANETELSAAGILADYLERISGAAFEITRDTARVREREILVGKTNRSESIQALSSDVADSEDGVRIAAKGEKLVLTGGWKRGALYAVYTLLEDCLGCRWFTSTLTVVPENSKPSVPANLDYTYVPCFLLRETYWRFSTTDVEFSVANKLNLSKARVPASLGGDSAGLAVNGVHTFDYYITNDLFDAHPEYFGADASGTRSVRMQPCLSNPDVVQLGIAFTKDFFRSMPGARVLSISQKDNKPACQCAECAAFDAAHGGHQSASLLNYVNTVAQGIAEEFPDCFIETLAYQYAQTPPEGLEVRDNVIIRLCNIGTCVMHNTNDPACDSNVRFCSDMDGWAALTENIYLWNYSTDFNCYYKLHPNLTTMQERFRYFRACNVISIFDQGVGEDIVSAELHELRTYLSAKLLWDPDTDVARHCSEFCEAYYGAAGADVVKFIGLFEEYARGYHPMMLGEGHLDCYGGGYNTANGTSLNSLNVLELDTLMKKMRSYTLTEEQAHRLDGFDLGWRLFKSFTTKGEFNWLSPFANPEQEASRLYDDLIAYGVTYLAEGGNIPVGEAYSPNFRTNVTFWYDDLNEHDMVIRLRATLYPVINKVLRILFGGWIADLL